MRQQNHIASAEYAAGGDFCRIFSQEMNRLYLLSYLLTGEERKAEQCFVSGLEDCVVGNQVFREWAQRWARRAVIQNAIRIVRPGSRQAEAIADPHSDRTGWAAMEGPLAAVAKLKPFDRFVFVLSFLEGYSAQDCRILLDCSRQDVARAQMRAVNDLARCGEMLPWPKAGVESQALAQAG